MPPVSRLPEQFSVLLVDHDDQERIDLAGIFRKERFKIFEAATGQEAESILERESIDILLADINLPLVSGLDLARDTRKKHPGIIIILMTGNTGYCSPLEALSAGADKFIIKPFDNNVLVGLFKKFTGRKTAVQHSSAAERE